MMTEEPVGTIINAVTKQPFTMEDPCVERGPNLGYNAAATASATQAVKEFLQVTLKPRVRARTRRCVACARLAARAPRAATLPRRRAA